MIITPDIALICVGSIKDKHCAAMTEGFCARLAHEARFEIVELRDSNKADEGKRICSLIDKYRGTAFALGEEGVALSSRSLATLLTQTPQKLLFIIGGPNGLSDDVKRKANKILSLSPMTFTHEMARLFLAEQLYRACTILHNRAYHRD